MLISVENNIPVHFYRAKSDDDDDDDDRFFGGKSNPAAYQRLIKGSHPSSYI